MFYAKRVPPDVREAYKKDVVAGLFCAVMSGLTMPFFAVIARETLKASAFEISIITMAPFGASLLSFIWANMMEGKRKMPFATASWVAARVMLLFGFFVTTSVSFTALVAVFWLLSSAAGPAYSALMKEIYPDRARGRIMGYVRVCMVVATIAVTAIAGPLLHAVSYRYVFPIAAVFGVLSALAFHSIPTNERTGDSGRPLGEFSRNAMRILREDGGFRWFCIGIFISGWANLMSMPVYALYQVDVLGIDTRWASVYTIAALAAATVAYHYWGIYIDRKIPAHVVAINALLLAFVPLNFCFANQAWMLLPAMVISGVVNAGLDLAFFSGVLHYAPHARVTHYQAVFATLVGVRGLVAPFFGAALVETGVMTMNSVFLTSAGLVLVSYLVHMRGMRKYDFGPDGKPSPAERHAELV